MKFGTTVVVMILALSLVSLAKADTAPVSALGSASSGRLAFGTKLPTPGQPRPFIASQFTPANDQTEANQNPFPGDAIWPNSWLLGPIYVQGTCSPSLVFVGFGNSVPQDSTCAQPQDPSDALVPTPEPGTLTLFGAGLLSLAGLVRRRLMQ